MLRNTTSIALLLALVSLALADAANASGHGSQPRLKRYPTPPSAAYGAPNWGPGRARSQPVWIPGHEEHVARQVWVPGRTRQEWVPAQIETRFDWCGRPFTVCVRPGHWRTVCEPGRYETRYETIWVPGHWQTAPC